ncbi:haloacid dehalogenase type II [Natronococcus sp. JC468]|uniref:haloacid dehalogenase type II n=1 Tax=Natronococcus sp. JC468 TaxID=1961921 RepID=UPI001438DD1A|nr:haloacid dehalogenase type II [Natronococcus sp. JC468]NKE38060.1 haloacid dehalogenase type II [Natronococcus sp. JC468]
MQIDPSRIESVVVDSYSTLVDVESSRKALKAHTPEATALARVWQLRTREYAMVGNEINVYRPAVDRHRLALKHALDVFDVDLTDDEIEEVLSVYHELDVFDDVRGGLETIRDAGYDIHILSNGDPALLDSLIDHTNLADIITSVISADDIHLYKPARELYEYTAERIGVPLGNLVHVTASWSDVNGALSAGMQGVWLNRKGRAWEPYGREPDLIIESFHELAESLTTENTER